MGILGIDSSCYTSSAAYVDENMKPEQARRVLSVPQGSRGLMQSGALFQHIKNLPDMLDELRKKVPDMRIDAVCASSRPRPAEGSYMPVFLASEGLGRSAASVLGVPFIATSHQQGHIRAAMYESGLPEGEFLAVHLSGGTTELLKVTEELDIELLGGTLDINAGQLVDRCGVAMGLRFPAGPHLEKLAAEFEPKSLIPLSTDGVDLHFSGAEAQIMRLVDEGKLMPGEIAIEVYSYIARAIAHMIAEGRKCTGIKNVLVTGGVASSAIFRSMLPDRLKRKNSRGGLYWGRPEYSSDNAVGVAMIGYDIFTKGDFKK